MTDLVGIGTGMLEGINQLLGCTLRWTDADPFTISMTLVNLEDEYAEIEWQFSRELMDEAFARPGQVAGVGDVTITHLPADQDLRIGLTDINQYRHALRIDAIKAYDFMLRTFVVVPQGTEDVHVDDTLRRILGAS